MYHWSTVFAANNFHTFPPYPVYPLVPLLLMADDNDHRMSPAEARNHQSVANRLTSILAELRRESSVPPSNDSGSRDLQTLLPSIANNGATTSHTERYTQQSRESRFDRTQQYAPRPQRKNLSRNGQKPYDPCADRSNSGKLVCKDVFLLPHPRTNTVTRYKIREELYARELVASAIEVPSDATEADIGQTFSDLFIKKLGPISGVNFAFVRTIGNKIDTPKVNCSWDGKMLKHIAGQGPIYIRSLVPIETGFGWVKEDDADFVDEIDDENSHDLY